MTEDLSVCDELRYEIKVLKAEVKHAVKREALIRDEVRSLEHEIRSLKKELVRRGNQSRQL